jgi:hypothetical protein
VHGNRDDRSHSKRQPLRAETGAVVMIDGDDRRSTLRDILCAPHVQGTPKVFHAGVCIPVKIAAAHEDQIAYDAGQQAGRIRISRIGHTKIPQALRDDERMAHGKI